MNGNGKRLAVANGHNIFQMLLVQIVCLLSAGRQTDIHTDRQTHSHRCQILTHPYAAITCVGNKSDVGLELDVKEVNGKAGQFTTNYGR